MKITRINLHHLSIELDKSLVWAIGRATERETLVVEITTDDGIVGWGETINISAFSILSDIMPLLIGKNPLERNVIVSYLHTLFGKSNCSNGLVMCSIGAVEMALWDIAGKYYNQPIYQLLGGKIRDAVPVYASGGYPTESLNLDEFAEEMKQYKDKGFKAFKIKIGYYSIEDDMNRIKTARMVLGWEKDIMVDGNQSYDLFTALKVGERLSAYQISWFEEPLKMDRYEQYADFRRKSTIPVAAGENYHSYKEFHQALLNQSLDILQPDIGNMGGLSEAIKLIPLAEYYGKKICPHTWGTPILMAATIHFCLSIPNHTYSVIERPFYNGPVMELDCTTNPIRDLLCDHDMRIIDGMICVPSKSGLGVEVNRKYLNKFIRTSCCLD